MTNDEACAAYEEMAANIPGDDPSEIAAYALPYLEDLAERTDGALHKSFEAFAEVQRLRLQDAEGNHDKIAALSIVGFENSIKVCNPPKN